ncbi:hypothetical protein [Aporhodopirellula aestuarii]|uniref:Outer membrane lipoprotein-sorting protein n=1 Tax=Aporhodopirellula aestuarii TaxID=2950107 RepID=A0ABT0UBL2_9BACT|nr:hypothetical protein [Aporhodopirellula aestuarii]MCM2374383.1 hypothetical protein [Aporhodopirellula aestuarii]
MSGNRSFVVTTVTFAKRGDMERESKATSRVYLMPKEDVVVINTDRLWYRSEPDREAGWTTNESVTDVQLVRILETKDERYSKLSTRNHNVFWFIPTASNADFLLANFFLEPVADDGKQRVFSLKFADTPNDEYWKNMKERGLELTGTLQFDAATGLPIKGEIKMLRDGYLREYRVTIESPSMAVPASASVVPKEVKEKLEKKISLRQ